MNRNQAAKQQVTKNQHYIPQFLLRQFYYGDSTQLWQIDTQSKELRLVNTKGVASYTNLYEVTALRENLIETWFSELEKRMSYLLNNINKSQYEVVEDDWLLQERCEKPTPLGVGWIALLIYTLLCIFLFFYTHSVLYYYYGKQI